jgi:hypothetical protein
VSRAFSDERGDRRFLQLQRPIAMSPLLFDVFLLLSRAAGPFESLAEDDADGSVKQTRDAVAIVARIHLGPWYPLFEFIPPPPPAWDAAVVDAEGITGVEPSLAFAPSGPLGIPVGAPRAFGSLPIATKSPGQPAIAYQDGIEGDLRYAWYNGASWATITVDGIGNTGRHASLAFGPDGQPAIAHFNLDIHFARRLAA